MYTGVSQTDCYSPSIHTHTNNDALYCSQTSVTSLPPDFTGNQLRLSKKGETYPPPFCTLLWLYRYIPAAIPSFPFLLFTVLAWLHRSLLFCSNLDLNARFLFFLSTRTKRRQARCYLLLLSPIPFLLLAFSPLCYSLATLAHNNKIPSAAISHQLHARGVASHPSPRNKDTQSVVVGTTVCQSHLHSVAFQPALFKWSSEGELLSRSGVHPDVEGEAQNMCGGGYLWKSLAAEKLCINPGTQEANVWWE